MTALSVSSLLSNTLHNLSVHVTADVRVQRNAWPFTCGIRPVPNLNLSLTRTPKMYQSHAHAECIVHQWHLRHSTLTDYGSVFYYLHQKICLRLPYHPSQTFSFPKRPFGKTEVVYRSCQANWFRSWSWLATLWRNQGRRFCFLCMKAVCQKKITVKPGSCDDAFVSYKIIGSY